MISLAHIIHPVIVKKSSDLNIAQPITFETMRVAQEFAKKKAKIKLYAIQYQDEKKISLPRTFIRVPDLTRSVANIKNFIKQRKLALIKDILDLLYKKSNADYLIYTNVDIALQPYFYKSVKNIIEKNGYDAFIINRRTITEKYKKINDIPLMYAEVGEKHKGWDCFVFKRDLYPKFDLGTGMIGQGWIGRILLSNMILHSKNFKIFEDFHLTFHIGNDKSWKNDDYRDYQEHNVRECKAILKKYEEENGSLDRKIMPGNFLNLEQNIN